jgi:hypothetical protein
MRETEKRLVEQVPHLRQKLHQAQRRILVLEELRRTDRLALEALQASGTETGRMVIEAAIEFIYKKSYTSEWGRAHSRLCQAIEEYRDARGKR